MTTILSNPTSVRLFIGATALIFLSTIPVKGATTLTTGDIAVIGMSADSADEFAWVPLVNLEAGTQIYFTDHGFHSKKSDFTSINSSGDTLMLYTTPAGGVLAGVVQTVISIGADYAFTGSSGWGQSSTPSKTNFSTSGDSIYAFQSSTSPTSATFGTPSDTNSTGLFAVTATTTDWTKSGSSGSFVETNLYPDLTDGSNAVAAGAGGGSGAEFDNVRYEGTTSGTAAELLAAIATTGNWTGTDATPASGYTNNGVTNFTVTAVPEPGTIAFLAGFGLCAVFLSRKSNKRQ
jgi:hypothetical protein